MTLPNSGAYLQGWLKALKGNQKWLIQAAAQAQKSSDYILNRKGGEAEQLAEGTAE
jgi:antirestriction protein ArdC